MVKVLRFTLMSLCMCFSVKSEAIEAHIKAYYDGDTVRVATSVSEFTLRIHDIDAPERNQPFGKKSRRALMMLCQNKVVDIHATGFDKYNRTLGFLKCGDEEVTPFMIKNGYAWFYEKYSQDATLASLQQEAQQKHLGLWAEASPQSPWAWRKQHPQYWQK